MLLVEATEGPERGVERGLASPRPSDASSAGVQLALELTRRLRDLRARAGGDEEPMCREMDAILALLGIGDEPQARQRRAGRNPLD